MFTLHWVLQIMWTLLEERLEVEREREESPGDSELWRCRFLGWMGRGGVGWGCVRLEMAVRH